MGHNIDCVSQIAIRKIFARFVGELFGVALDAIHHPECTYFYDFDQDNYKRIDGSPIAFMASEKLLRIFETADPLKKIAEPKVGLQTGNNDDFLRLWYEVDKKI